MESLRDVKRVMEREIQKGSCPLQFDCLSFGEKPFRSIESEEKLNEILSYLLRIGDFKQYAGRTIINNVYMDLDMCCRNVQFKRTRSVMERGEMYRRVQCYKKKLQPDYNGKVCLETVQCVFHLQEEEIEKYRMSYDGRETYGFIMSNKYILGLFTYCEAVRKSVVADGVGFGDLPEEEQKIVRLENVRNVLFQALLLDNVVIEEGKICAEMCTILLLE